MVDGQDRVASSLYEAHTSGFTIFNMRGYWRPTERFTLYSGVENLGDRFYREHLDYRPRPGLLSSRHQLLPAQPTWPINTAFSAAAAAARLSRGSGRPSQPR